MNLPKNLLISVKSLSFAITERHFIKTKKPVEYKKEYKKTSAVKWPHPNLIFKNRNIAASLSKHQRFYQWFQLFYQFHVSIIRDQFIAAALYQNTFVSQFRKIVSLYRIVHQQNFQILTVAKNHLFRRIRHLRCDQEIRPQRDNHILRAVDVHIRIVIKLRINVFDLLPEIFFPQDLPFPKEILDVDSHSFSLRYKVRNVKIYKSAFRNFIDDLFHFSNLFKHYKELFPAIRCIFFVFPLPQKREVAKRQKRMPLLSGLGALPAKETSSTKQFPARPKPK